MMDFSVIGIVGFQASGKTVVASHLVDLGASRVRMGDVVWNEVEERGLKINDKNVAMVAKDLRRKEGMDAIAKRCVPLIKEEGEDNSIVVVDGIRGISEVEVFEREFKENFFLISIISSEDTRFERIKSRGREDDIKDFESFKKKDKRELDWGMKEAMESADFEILNEGSIKHLKKKVTEIYERISNEYGDQSGN